MNTKLKVECQIVIDKGIDIEKEMMNEFMFRLERIANTSYKFRIHINNVGLLYQMMIGTNDENTTKKEFINEINKLKEIANILGDNIECRINVLQTVGKFKKENGTKN